MARIPSFREEEKQFILEHYSSVSMKELAKMLSERFGVEHSWKMVQSMAHRLGAKKYAQLSEEEKQFALENYPKMTSAELSRQLEARFGVKRNADHLRNLMAKYGIRKKAMPFTPEEIALIREEYGSLTPSIIANRCSALSGHPRTKTDIIRKANLMGITWRDQTPFLTLSDAAEILDASVNKIRKILRSRKLPHKRGIGNTILVDDAIIEALRRELAPPPWPAVEPKRAASLLGYASSRSLITHNRDRGFPIAVHKQGGHVYFKAEDVFAEMRRRGKTPPLSYVS